MKFFDTELLSRPMDGDTLRSRLITLLQRSRQAHRLYSSMERMQRGEAAEFTEMQAAAWRTINSELVKQLTSLLDAPHSRQLTNHVVLLRDRFLAEFRSVEAELNQRHRELVLSAEKGDFIRSAVVSRALVGLKARSQAAHAAFTELDDLTGTQAASSVTGERVIGERVASNAIEGTKSSNAVTGAALVKRQGMFDGAEGSSNPIVSSRDTGVLRELVNLEARNVVGAKESLNASSSEIAPSLKTVAKVIPLQAANRRRS